jgi:uncharacterized protein with FMN-binding domain
MRPADHPNRGILALGSAAVIAVYAAGYVRTKPAAAKLAAESSARRRPITVDSSPAAAPPIAVVVKPLADSATRGKKAAKPKLKSDAQKLIEDPESAAAESLAIAQAREEKERPTKFIVPPLNYVPPPKVEPTKADSMTKPELPPWNDGTYFGWGTSRHGDIKAGVEIRGGAIARAYIAECLTRYSCSWVEHLPRQVIDRQSPNVDNVTSATESANAFYYAIYSALKQAK